MSKQNPIHPRVDLVTGVMSRREYSPNKRTATMSDLYYAASLGKSAHLSENFLVQLICEGHQGLKSYNESSRKAAACKIAEDALKSRYGSEVMADVNYKEVRRYADNIPMNLGDANFTASCGCRVWWI